LYNVYTFLPIGHAGVNPIVSQTSLLFLTVVIGISFVGLVHGRIKGEQLRAHRWIMTSATLILLIPVFLVMLPATLVFYTDPDVELFSAMFTTTVFHAVLGFPALVLMLVFVSNDLPTRTRHWMR
jgi:hypothetical protein